jgi:aminopeptidase N
VVGARRIAGVALAVVLSGCTTSPARARHDAALPAAVPTRPAPSVAPPDGTSTPAADPVYPDHGNPAIDVLHYDLTLAWAPDAKLLTGTAILRIRVVRAVSQIRLDLIEAYTVDQAGIDGAAAPAGRDGDHVVLAAGHPLAAGTVVSATIRYHGTPHQVPFPGHRSDVSQIGARVTPDGGVYSMAEPYGGYTWFPCSDQPSDKALLDVAITTPPGWSGVSSGQFTGSTPVPSGSTTHWRSTRPIATYLVAFAVDRYERVDDTGPHGLPVTYWFRPQDKAVMLPTLRRTPVLIGWLEARLGRYPFDSAGVVVVPEGSALETQTMVTLGPLTGQQAVAVLLHELSHQWFGDAVTPLTWRDVWLNEGFATYIQMLYEVDQFGTSQPATLRAWAEGDRIARAEAGPAGHYRADEFAAHNVYYGPALMLHKLREQVGDPKFYAVLHDWPQHHLYSNADRATFIAWLSAYLGHDEGPLVNLWLDSPTTPSS